MLKKHAYLLSCSLAEADLQMRFPTMWRYYEDGKRQGVHLRYLCAHRSPWYAQEFRQPPPLLCTYMGRQAKNNPFRFILNHSSAIAANTYLLLYPKPYLRGILQEQPDYLRHIWQTLNALSPDTFVREGRVYGGGLYKIEPKELAHVPVDGLSELLPVYSLWGTHQ